MADFFIDKEQVEEANQSSRKYWDEMNSQIAAENKAYKENLDRYKVNIPQEEYDIINNAIANADVPEDEAYRWAAAFEVQRQYNIPLQDAYKNLEQINAALWGDKFDFTPKTTFKAIVDSGRLGVNTVRQAGIGTEVMARELRGENVDDLLAQFEEIEKENESLYDYMDRNFAVEALKFGAQSLPFTGYVAGAGMLGSLIAPVVGTVAGFTASMQQASGLQYMQLRQAGATKGNAFAFSLVDGALEAIVETSLGNVAGAMGKSALGATAKKEALEKITANVFKRLNYNGTMKNLALKLGSEYIKENFEEGMEEVIQDLINKGTSALAAELGTYNVDPVTAQQVAKDAWENFYGGLAGSLVLGLPTSAIKVRSDLKNHKNIKQDAKDIPAYKDFEKKNWDNPIFEEMEGDAKKEALQQIWEKGQQELEEEETEAAKAEAEVTAAPGEGYEETKTDEETGDEIVTSAVRDENGKLIIQDDITTTNEDGTKEGVYHVGDNTVAEDNNYGAINYTLDEDNKTVTINRFSFLENRQNLFNEVYDNFAQDFAGYDIKWDPKLDKAKEIKKTLIESNPTGQANGLNYYAGEETVADVKTRRGIAAEIKKVRPNMSNFETAMTVNLLEARAKTNGQTITEYFKSHFGENMIGNNAELEAAAALNGDNLKNKTSAIAWKRLEQQVRAQIYVLEKGDLSSIVHEIGHDFQVTLEGDLKTEAEKLFNVENGDWLKSVYKDANGNTLEDPDTHQPMNSSEAFAYLFQEYYKNGKTQNEEMQTLFQKFAAFLRRCIQAIRDFGEVPAEVQQFYDKLLAGNNEDLFNKAYKDVVKQDRQHRQQQQEAEAAAAKQQAEAEQEEIKKRREERAANAETTDFTTEEVKETAEEKQEAQTQEETNTVSEVLDNTNLNAQQKQEVQKTLQDPEASIAEQTEAISEAADSAFDPDTMDLFQTEVSQMDIVRARYEGTENWLKAPNGKDTNLTEKQWLQVRTENFKNWFGDWENDPVNASKVLDENGEPKVVYHGTISKKEFYIFDTANEKYKDNLGSHFGPKETAEEFSDQRMYEVFLNLRNPFKPIFDFFADEYNNAYLSILVQLNQEAKTEEAKNIFNNIYDIYPNLKDFNIEEMSDEDILDSFDSDKNLENYNNSKTWQEHRNALVDTMLAMIKAEGYDSLRYENWYEGDTNNECYVALKSNQIKSATDNNGDFDPGLEDIRYQHDFASEEDREKFIEASKIWCKENYPATEAKRILTNMETLRYKPGTTEKTIENETGYFVAVYESLMLQRDIKNAIEHKPLDADSWILQENEKKLATDRAKNRKQNPLNAYKALLGGEEGIIKYLYKKNVGLLGDAGKAEKALNGSITSCQPSVACASYCYVFEEGGHYVGINSMLKSELVNWYVQKHPSDAADKVAIEYMTYKKAGYKLRLFDKGDLTADWLPFIQKLNNKGIGAHLFSKRGEYLSQVDPVKNRLLLSIDKTNEYIAESYPKLDVALVVSGKKDMNLVDKYMDRLGVVFAEKNGSKRLDKITEIKPIRENIEQKRGVAAGKLLCPVDAYGVKMTCIQCQHYKNGCWAENKEAIGKYDLIYQGKTAILNEAERQGIVLAQAEKELAEELELEGEKLAKYIDIIARRMGKAFDTLQSPNDRRTVEERLQGVHQTTGIGHDGTHSKTFTNEGEGNTDQLEAPRYQTSDFLDNQYMAAVNAGNLEAAQQMVDAKLEEQVNKFSALQDDSQEKGFKYHRGPEPKKWRTMYAVFNVSEDGFRAAYAGNKNPTPVGVTLDAQMLEGYTSDKMTFNDGTPKKYIKGDTGTAASELFSTEKLEELGLKKGDRMLLLRGGKHGSDLTNFKQINKKSGALPHNKLMFEVEVGMSDDGDLTEYVKTNGRFDKKGNQGLEMVEPNQFYFFKTNPNAAGNWGIAGTFRIKRLVPQEEITQKTAEYNASVREQNKLIATENEGKKKKDQRKLLEEIEEQQWEGGYHPEDFGLSVEAVDQMYQDGLKKKLTDAVTYDDEGNVIPLSQRFNSDVLDLRYQTNNEIKENWWKIRKEAMENGTYLRAPNGKMTNLDIVTWLQVRTPEFKSWYGDWENFPASSLSLDENGEPKVYYHQTENVFTVFDPRHKGAGYNDNETPYGVFLKPNKKEIRIKGNIQMPIFAKLGKTAAYNTREELVYEVSKAYPEYKELYEKYKKLDKKYEAEYDALEAEEDKAMDKLYEKKDQFTQEEWEIAAEQSMAGTTELLKKWTEETNEVAVTMKETLTKYFKENGYNSVFINSDVGGNNKVVTTMIILDPHDVKSAENNVGTFDPDNSDIRYQTEEPVTRDNYYLNTIANFEIAEKPSRKPDYVSPSGSVYWYTEEGVYREATHWGVGVGTCDWYLNGANYQTKPYGTNIYGEVFEEPAVPENIQDKISVQETSMFNATIYEHALTGFAKWTDFKHYGDNNYYKPNEYKLVNFQTQAELNEEAKAFDTWVEFMDFCQCMHCLDEVSPIPADADAQWYQTTWELANGMKPEAEINEETVQNQLQQEGTVPTAMDAMFTAEIDNDENFDNFMHMVAYYSNINLDSEEWQQVADAEDAAERDRIDQLQTLIRNLFHSQTAVTAIKKIIGGRELDPQHRNRLRSEMKNNFNGRDFRLLYAEIMDDPAFRTEGDETVSQQIRKQEEMVQKRFNLVLPEVNIEDMSPQQRKEYAQRLDNIEIAEALKDGTLKMDDQIDRYVKTVEEKYNNLKKQYKELQESVYQEVMQITNEQQKDLLKIHEELIKAEAALEKSNSDLLKKTHAGIKITKKYQQKNQNLKHDYNEILRKYKDALAVTKLTAEVRRAITYQNNLGVALGNMNALEEERATMQDVQNLRKNLVKKTMRRVRFDTVDYENARKIIAIQRVFQPNLIGGVNKWIGQKDPYLRGVISGVLTDKDYRNEVTQYLHDHAKASAAYMDFMAKWTSLITAQTYNEGMEQFKKWDQKTHDRAILYLPKEDWIQELMLKELDKEREESIDLDIEITERREQMRDEKGNAIIKNQYDENGKKIDHPDTEQYYYKTMFGIEASDEIKQMIRDAVGEDIYNNLLYRPFNEWTVEEMEKLARRVDELYQEGRKVYAARKKVQQDRAAEIRKRIEKAVNNTGIEINEDDPEDVKKAKQEKIDAILGLNAEIKGTQAGKDAGIKSRWQRLLGSYNDATVLRVARILDGNRDGDNFTMLYRREDEAYNVKQRSIVGRANKINAAMERLSITPAELAQTVEVDGRKFTVDELLYFAVANEDYVEDPVLIAKGLTGLSANNDWEATSRNAVMFGNMLSDTESVQLRQAWEEEDKELARRVEAGELTPEEKQALAVGELLMNPGTQKFINACKKRFAAVLLEVNKLDPKYKELIKVIEDDYTEQYDRMNEISIKEFNTPVHRVKHYVPLVRMESTGADNAATVKEDLLAAMGQGAGKQWVNKGMTKRRIRMNPLNQKPVQMGLYKTWADSVERTEHFIAYSAYVRELNRIYKDRDAKYVRQYITNRYGPGMLAYVDDYINEVANPNALKIREKGAEILHELRGKTASAYLGWKAAGVIKQAATSPWPYMQFVSPAEYLSAAWKIFTSRGSILEAIEGKTGITRAKAAFQFMFDSNIYQDIKDKSVFMLNRTMDPMADLIDEMADKVDQNKVERKINNFNKAGMAGLEYIDWACVAPGWYACYLQKLNELQKAAKAIYENTKQQLTEANYEEEVGSTFWKTADQIEAAARQAEQDAAEKIEREAVRYADDCTRACQPSNRTTDIAPLFKQGGEFKKAYLQFQTSLNVIWNNLAYDIKGAAKNPEMVKRDKFKRITGTIIGYVAAGIFMNSIMEGLGGDDDDDGKKADDRLKNLVYYATTQFTDAVPLVGSELTNTMDKLITGKASYQSSGTDMTPTLTKMLSIVTNTKQGNWAKAAEMTAEGFGMYLGLPVSGFKNVMKISGVGDKEPGLEVNLGNVYGILDKEQYE